MSIILKVYSVYASGFTFIISHSVLYANIQSITSWHMRTCLVANYAIELSSESEFILK